jgi:hypothetical protein
MCYNLIASPRWFALSGRLVANSPCNAAPDTVRSVERHGAWWTGHQPTSNFTCISGGRTTITLIRISRGPGPFTSHPASNIAGIFLQTFVLRVYEAAPPDSPSNLRTTRTSADRRRYPPPAHVAQHPMPRGFQPRPHDLFSSYKPSHMLLCASRTWLRIRRGQSITNTPLWRGCDEARTASD